MTATQMPKIGTTILAMLQNTTVMQQIPPGVVKGTEIKCATPKIHVDLAYQCILNAQNCQVSVRLLKWREHVILVLWRSATIVPLKVHCKASLLTGDG